MPSIDYIVQERTFENILSEIQSLRPYLNMKFGTQVEITAFLSTMKKGNSINLSFKLDFFDAGENAELWELAFVSNFETTPVLNCDRRLWEEAKEGEPLARYILAHELGHIVLHSGKARPKHFSAIGQSSGFIPDERRAEWQANIFATFFLAFPEKTICILGVDAIARRYGIPEDVANLAKEKCLILIGPNSYFGEACSECGNFTMVRNGTCLKCDTCGGTSGCS